MTIEPVILQIPSGYVLAFFFILFDVLCLALVDVLLIRLSCSLYYREISEGRSLNIRSFDIPGVVTYLVGKATSFANIVTFSLKIIVIVFIFFINFNVESAKDGERFSSMDFTATFDFIPTNEEWNNASRIRAVERSPEFSRWSCKDHPDPEDPYKVTFYRTAFSLSNSAILLNETDIPNATAAQYPIDSTTLLCLSPKNVSEKYIRPILKVLGCSKLIPDQNCYNSTKISRTIDAQINVSSARYFSVPAGTGKIGYGFKSMNETQVKKGFPEYSNPKLHCVLQCLGLTGPCCGNRRDRNCRKSVTPCILVEKNEKYNTTLLEKWYITENSGVNIRMERMYPGPILEGLIDLDTNRAGVSLLDVDTNSNWWEFAGVILTDSLVYRYNPQKYDIRYTATPTEIPPETIILGALTLCVVIFGSIAVYFTIGRDNRPRFNTVNGLSSILREERFPTGHSFREGNIAILGLSREPSGRVRLGPISSPKDSIELSTIDEKG